MSPESQTVAVGNRVRALHDQILGWSMIHELREHQGNLVTTTRPTFNLSRQEGVAEITTIVSQADEPRVVTLKETPGGRVYSLKMEFGKRSPLVQLLMDVFYVTDTAYVNQVLKDARDNVSTARQVVEWLSNRAYKGTTLLKKIQGEMSGTTIPARNSVKRFWVNLPKHEQLGAQSRVEYAFPTSAHSRATYLNLLVQTEKALESLVI